MFQPSRLLPFALLATLAGCPDRPLPMPSARDMARAGLDLSAPDDGDDMATSDMSHRDQGIPVTDDMAHGPGVGPDLATVDMTTVDMTTVDMTTVDMTTVDMTTVDMTTVDMTTVDLATPDMACVPASDAALCAAAHSECGPLVVIDCGQTRHLDCGGCPTDRPACGLGGHCVAPQCGTRFSATGTVVTSLSTPDVQEALLGASADGRSLLYLRSGLDSCVFNGAALRIADALGSDPLDYTSQDLALQANLSGFARTEETMTLSADGLSIIGVTGNLRGFAVSRRSAAGSTDFAPATSAPFTTINAQLAAMPAGTQVMWPVLSADGLLFLFNIVAGPATQQGTYRATRSSVDQPFDSGVLMEPAVQQWTAISGLSADTLTAFATKSFGTSLLSRTSWADPFSNVATQSPPGSAYRVVPIAGCQKLIGTCEPGGCFHEDICIWSALR